MTTLLERPNKTTFTITRNQGTADDWRAVYADEMAPWKPRSGDELMVEAEYMFTGLTTGLKRSAVKLPIFGLVWRPSSTGWGCRKPTYRKPGMSLRWTLLIKKVWNRPKGHPGRKKVWRFFIRPYIYARWPTTLKRCGRSYNGPGWERTEVKNGQKFRLRYIFQWNSPGKANGWIHVYMDGKPVYSWGRLCFDTPQDFYHCERVTGWTNFWKRYGIGSGFSMTRKDLTVEMRSRS